MKASTRGEMTTFTALAAAKRWLQSSFQLFSFLSPVKFPFQFPVL